MQTSTTVTQMLAKAQCNIARPGKTRAYTLIEALLVLGIVSIVITLVMPNLFGILRSDLFKEDAGRFVNTLRLAAQEAVYRNKTIAVVIDITDGYYTVYEANLNDVYSEDDWPLIDRQGLDACYIEELQFADGSRSLSGDIVLHADPQGWRSTWLFTLIDLDERRRWVRCDIFSTRVMSETQPLAVPRSYSEVSMSSSI